ncbi:hypothetical protein ACTD5D_30895 [Nocardia takedensis]|uniref:hypothetical protein n=1 Tax=Nocardia takedensis TaxID=259390 RepID=UPI003F77220E
MIAPYDHVHLFNKAKLFINRALAPPRGQNFEENALWASLALEILAKAALSKINPMLIADPVSDDGKSMLIASGIIQDTTGFKSIAAKAAFSRCARAFPPFSQKVALEFAYDRNAYLHSSEAFNARFPEDVWWSRYWSQAVLLLTAQDKDISDLVGYAQLKRINDYLASNNAFVKQMVQSLITRAAQRLELIENNSLSARVAAEIKAASRISIFGEYQTETDCIVCKNPKAVIGGGAVEQYDRDPDDTFGDAWLTINSDFFYCNRCGLSLEEYQHIVEAGLPTEFEVYEEGSVYEGDEYMNE